MDNGLVLRKANANSNFSFANDRLQLTRIATRMMGGEITGDADIRNVVPSIAPKPEAAVVNAGKAKGKRSPTAAGVGSQEQEGSAKLHVSGVSLNELSRAFSSRSMPLDKLNAVGRVTGSVDVAWKQTISKATADLALDVAAPTQVANNQLPVNGSVRGRYNALSGRTDLNTLSLATPRTRIDASGSMGATTVGLTLKANTSSLADFQPLLAGMGAAPPPLELGGSLRFDGTVVGRLRAPQVEGHLEATNFNVVYTPTAKPEQVKPVTAPAQSKHRSWLHPTGAPPPPQAQPTAQARRIHVDQFDGDVEYSQTGIALHKAVVQEGSAQLNLDGSAVLEKGAFTDNSPFHVQAVVHNADVTSLQRAAGTDYPVSGTLNFSLQASGTVANPHGQGQVSLTGGEAEGRPVKTFTSKIVFADHRAQLEDIHLLAAHGAVGGTAAYDFRSEEGKLDLVGRSIDLADVPEIQLPRLQTAGVADFTMKGSGTLEHPVLNAHVEIDSLVLNGDKVGNLVADAVTRGRQLTLTARSKFPKASFALDGNVDLEGDMPGSATLKFTNLDINPFLPGAVRNDVTQHASLDGEAELSGPFKQPRRLQGSLHIQQFSVEVEHVGLRSDGPIKLTFADEVITVQRFTLTSADTHFTLTGTASLRDAAQPGFTRQWVGEPEVSGDSQSRPDIVWGLEH